MTKDSEAFSRYVDRYLELYRYLRLEGFRPSTASIKARATGLTEQSVAERKP